MLIFMIIQPMMQSVRYYTFILLLINVFNTMLNTIQLLKVLIGYFCACTCIFIHQNYPCITVHVPVTLKCCEKGLGTKHACMQIHSQEVTAVIVLPYIVDPKSQRETNLHFSQAEYMFCMRKNWNHDGGSGYVHVQMQLLSWSCCLTQPVGLSDIT